MKQLSLEIDVYETSPINLVKVLPLRTRSQVRRYGRLLEEEQPIDVTNTVFGRTENYVQGANIYLSIE